MTVTSSSIKLLISRAAKRAALTGSSVNACSVNVKVMFYVPILLLGPLLSVSFMLQDSLIMSCVLGKLPIDRLQKSAATSLSLSSENGFLSRIVSLDIEFMVDNSLLSALEKHSALSGPVVSGERATVPGVAAPIVAHHFSAAPSTVLSLPIIVKTLFMMDSWIYLGFSYLEFSQLHGSVCLCCSPNLGHRPSRGFV